MENPMAKPIIRRRYFKGLSVNRLRPVCFPPNGVSVKTPAQAKAEAAFARLRRELVRQRKG